MNTTGSKLLKLSLWAVALILVPSVGASPCGGDSTALATFRSCIEGSSSTCQLPTGTHSVTCTLFINNANLTHIYGGTSDPADTVLQRGSASLTFMMQWSNAAQGLIIDYLTFDGNRWGFGTAPSSGTTNVPNLTCLDTNIVGNSFWDLDLGPATIVTAQNLNFRNAPDTALNLQGSTYVGPPNNAASTVSLSNFGSLSVPSRAPRATATFVAGPYAGAYYNNMYYPGTAGVTVLSGHDQYVYGNTIFSGYYEFGARVGGVLVVYPFSNSAVTVAANIVDQNYWYSPQIVSGQPVPTINGCPTLGFGAPAGVEAYGSGVYFYNNDISHGAGGGMALGVGIGAASTFVVSGSNPFDAFDSAKYVHDNWLVGIEANAVNGLTLDGVRVCHSAATNPPSGVGFPGTWSNSGVNFISTSGTGFINGATMSDNHPGNTAFDTYSNSNVTNKSPSITACP